MERFGGGALVPKIQTDYSKTQTSSGSNGSLSISTIGGFSLVPATPPISPVSRKPSEDMGDANDVFLTISALKETPQKFLHQPMSFRRILTPRTGSSVSSISFSTPCSPPIETNESFASGDQRAWAAAPMTCLNCLGPIDIFKPLPCNPNHTFCYACVQTIIVNPETCPACCNTIAIVKHAPPEVSGEPKEKKEAAMLAPGPDNSTSMYIPVLGTQSCLECKSSRCIVAACAVLIVSFVIWIVVYLTF